MFNSKKLKKISSQMKKIDNFSILPDYTNIVSIILYRLQFSHSHMTGDRLLPGLLLFVSHYLPIHQIQSSITKTGIENLPMLLKKSLLIESLKSII